MNPIEAKIEALAKQLNQRNEKAASTTRMTAVVYGVLVIFVFGYTLFIAHAIEKQATPDSVSAFIRDRVSSVIPSLHKKILAVTEAQAPVITERALQTAHEYIPKIEDKIKQTIDDQVASFIKDIKRDLIPELMSVLDTHAKEMNEHAETLTDAVAAKALTDSIVKEIDDKINYEIVGDEFFGKFHEMRKSLDELATTPVSQMTRKQLAERNAIVHWLCIVKGGDSLNSLFSMFVRDIGFTFNSLMDGSFFINPPPPPPLASENPEPE